MSKVRRISRPKAARATARHSWRGFTSKAKRKPPRPATLLGAGAAIGTTVGAAVGWVAGRRTASAKT
jgi:hypothetical protein